MQEPGHQNNLQIKGNPQGSSGTDKEAQPKQKKKAVMYQVPRAECESVNIGESEGTLEKRISEHKGAVKKHDERNSIAVHSWTKQHRVHC